MTLSSDYVALVTGDKGGGRRRRGWSGWEGGAASLPCSSFMPVKCIHLHRGWGDGCDVRAGDQGVR